MQALFLIVTLSVGLGFSPPAWCLAKTPRAKAMLVNTQGESVGEANFFEEGRGLRMKLRVRGLSPGKHGIHFHAGSRCEPPDFKSAQGHFNPDQKLHGLKQTQGHHAGDLPNLEVQALGWVDTELSSETAELNSGPLGLLSPSGTTLIIHAGEDDQLSDPAGNSGNRVVCGEIRSVPKGRPDRD